MRNRFRIVLLLLILLTAGAGLVYWWSIPRLLAVSPPDGASALPAGSGFSLSFSRPMQAGSVAERLEIQPDVEGILAWEQNTLTFTPAQPWPAGTSVQVRLAAGSRASGLLALPIPKETSWSFTIRLPRLAYLYPAQGPANIYILNPLSGESTPLTNSPSGVQDFQVNAKGSAIYYSARSGAGGSNIYRLLLSGDQLHPQKGENEAQAEAPSPELILPCPEALCRSLAVSPDEQYLAYEHTALPGSDQPNYPQVRMISLAPENLPATESSSTLALPSHQTLQPSWSPDGYLTFYDTNTAAFIIMDAGAGERARLPNQTGQPGAWHPNGRFYLAAEIFFLDENISDTLTDLEPLANSHLLLFDWQSGAMQDLTPGENMEDTAPAFSPDGEYLAFARKFLDIQNWTPGRQLWLLHLGDSQARPLTDDPLYNHFELAWSPAGDRLAYVRFNQGALTEPPEIWLIDPFNGQATQLVLGGYAPQWMP
ncbi:MAG: PD40 domain-containing protein [Anaerolineales bacterium]|nr:PD40 domain-containing protein [Anaerolineales bacterium]